MAMYSFEATLEIIGINPFVFVPQSILDKLFQDAKKTKGHIPIHGIVNGKPYRQTLVRYAGKWRFYINMEMLKNSPQRIGEKLQLEIAFDPKERIIEAHPKWTRALNKNIQAKEIFENLSASKQKEIIRYIAQLKTESIRDKNIDKAILFLLGNVRFVGRDKP